METLQRLAAEAGQPENLLKEALRTGDVNEANRLRLVMAAENADKVRGLAQTWLPNSLIGGPTRNAVMNVTGSAMPNGMPYTYDPALMEEQFGTLASLQGRFPRTLRGLSGIEPVTIGENAGGNTIAHYRPIGGTNAQEWALGVRPELAPDLPGTYGSMGASARASQAAGWHTTPMYANPEEQTVLHEFGHALDARATDFLNKNAVGSIDRRMIYAQRAYNDLKQQLVSQANRGELSDYSGDALLRAIYKNTPDPQTLGEGLRENLIQARAPEAFRPGEIGQATLNRLAKEPIAEGFAKDPGMFAEALAKLKGAGFEGAATPELLGLGAAGLGAQLVVPKIIPGTAGHVLADAATGASFGGMAAGPWGALGGGVLGAGAGVLRHFL
jgi:hypothetical protein